MKLWPGSRHYGAAIGAGFQQGVVKVSVGCTRRASSEAGGFTQWLEEKWPIREGIQRKKLRSILGMPASRR